MTLLGNFFSGAIMMGYLVIALFFFRFWRRTAESLFAAFAAAFTVLALERIALLFTSTGSELRPFVYLIRFSAFMLIVLAIAMKNRR
jgi:uncharacterized membrane protein